MAKPLKMTPMLEQYFEVKSQAPDAILLFRLGDFYEMFFEDAEKAAPILGLVLTSRGKGGDSETPMCGVPYHAAEAHIAKLIRRGFRVAICDQVEEATAGKTLVRREIVRIITPGTAVDGSIVDRDSVYLMGLVVDGDETGVAWLDASTGDLFVTSYQSDHQSLMDDVARFRPREVVISREKAEAWRERFEPEGLTVTFEDESYFDRVGANEYLCRHFGTVSLRGFGLEENDVRVTAAAAALRYAVSRHKKTLTHVTAIRVERGDECLVVDSSTLRNLEVLENREGEGENASLWGVLNATKTAMGARLLRRWVTRPLSDRDAIFDRHDAVDELVRNPSKVEQLTRELGSIADLERLTARVTIGNASPRECRTLAASLGVVAELKTISSDFSGRLLRETTTSLDPLHDIASLIESTIVEDPPAVTRDGGMIRSGVHQELDELKTLTRDSKSILMQIETDEKEKTSIASLKVRYNNVFGYYIEVSKSNLGKVPDRYIRKQTLVNAERYITPELKEIEERILSAEDRSKAIEMEIWEGFLKQVAGRAPALRSTAGAVASIDVLATFAGLAMRRRWCRPELSDRSEIVVEGGRHPVVEAVSKERFIPNDSEIDAARNGMQIITGPNMGGKSTYLRQIALIVMMNQIGSFVPATRARLGIFDRVFTRVGASDNLARGESTFMVEMHETANILNNATDRSLIVLDEVGRGTATFDGLSLAWAIIEYLHDHKEAITLFATHYHEVTDLADTKERVANFNVSVKEWKDQIIFLRKVVPGPADKSYGIQVAKLAGIPAEVTNRAMEILAVLEQKEHDVVDATSRIPGKPAADGRQLALFSTREDDALRAIRTVDADSLTPLDALNLVADLKRKLTE